MKEDKCVFGRSGAISKCNRFRQKSLLVSKNWNVFLGSCRVVFQHLKPDCCSRWLHITASSHFFSSVSSLSFFGLTACFFFFFFFLLLNCFSLYSLFSDFPLRTFCLYTFGFGDVREYCLVSLVATWWISCVLVSFRLILVYWIILRKAALLQ